MVGIKSKFLLASGVMVALAILLELSLAAGDIGGAKIAVDGTKSSEDDEILSRLNELSLSRIRISAEDIALRLKCSLYETSLRSMLGEKANNDVIELFDQVISALSKIKLPFGYKNPFLRVLKKCSDITKAGEEILKSSGAEIADQSIGESEVKLDPIEDEISAEQQSTDESPEVEGETQDVTTTITPSPADDLLKSKTQEKLTKETNENKNLATSSIRERGNKACSVSNNLDSEVDYNYGSSILNNIDCSIHYNDDSQILNNQDSMIRNNRKCTVINCQDCTIYNNTGIQVINQSGVTITGRRN